MQKRMLMVYFFSNGLLVLTGALPAAEGATPG